MDYNLLVGLHFRDDNTGDKMGLSPFLLRNGTISDNTNRRRINSTKLEETMEDQPSTSNEGNGESLPHESSSNRSSLSSNILQNHNFSRGLHSWLPNNCHGYVVSPDSDIFEEKLPKPSGHCAVITNRKECWQGLEQDITSRVSPGSTYMVSARVAISGGPLHVSADIVATLKLEYHNSPTNYKFIARTSVSKDRWEILEGTFSLSSMADRVVFYLEGPAPGIDLLIEAVTIATASPVSSSSRCVSAGNENIIRNHDFEDGLSNWSGRGCQISLHESMGNGKVLPVSGKVFASTTGRTHSWNGIQQDISGVVRRKVAYNITGFVRIFGNNVTSAIVQATLWVQTPDHREEYISLANSQATDKDWVQLQGKFLLNSSPSKVVIFLEGPDAGIDILLNGLVVKHAKKILDLPRPVIENADFGVNILSNSNLSDRTTNDWFPFGCNLGVVAGSPHILPPLARDSLRVHEPLSGHCIHATNRTQNWMGPAQMITDKLKLYVTYQVSAWVRLGSGANGPQNVNVAISIDGQWVNGGQVEINDGRWHEVCGSFRLEKKAAKVMVYVQGPAPGVNFMVARLHIFPVNHQARFPHLKLQTDKIRKHDIILKFSGLDSSSLRGTFVNVRQIKNSFPIGSCISRSNIDNEEFVDFFVKHFNWAVFGNELKWYWTESQQGKLNYKDADELLSFCDRHNIQTRGHCIFWEVEDTIQSWIKGLNTNDLMTAVQNRLTSLLTRYKGKFKHYDVNNEMLHGSFYQDRLGNDIRAYMFKSANQLDPSATLFVNDYHVEDGHDPRSCPERYIEQILDLQEQGAPIGGIGIQGHIDHPVGSIVSSALDQLGVLGLPIWFTELDVSSDNEHVRADDLEVMLREAYAHPAVEGIMLWGFWELFMSRENAHLVNAEGEVNEAGKRFIELKQEWLSNAHGDIDEQGQFQFRGFQGDYEVEIVQHSKKIVKKFVVHKGNTPLLVTLDL